MSDLFRAKYLGIYLSGINPDNAESTRARKTRDIRRFLDFLAMERVKCFDNFDVNLVYRFLDSLNLNKQSSLNSVKFSLKEFFNVLNKEGIIGFDGRQIFPIISDSRRECIPSFYETEEIRKMIDAFDPGSPNYTRDKTMFLLAAQMGLRASDIIQLKISNILWDRDLIEKVQIKTGNPVSVPMPENIKFLLIDYIRNHRPESDSDYVFINRKTGGIYHPWKLYYIVKSLIGKTDIVVGNRKIGPHSLRHSLATRLLKDNTPMPVITGVLGHKNLYTTRMYLSIDIDSLRSMSLEVDS